MQKIKALDGFKENNELKNLDIAGLPYKVTNTKINGTLTGVNFNYAPTTVPMAQYGVEIDIESGTTTYLGDSVGKAFADFSNISPWNGENVIIEEQYMKRIPKFYYKRVALKTEAIPQSADENEMGRTILKWQEWISLYPHDGYTLHPAFYRDGRIVEEIYFSRFEGSIYDMSESKYLLEDEQVADFGSDVLCSIPNAKPCSGLTQNLTIENARKLANNRNSSSNYLWGQQDFTSVSALQLLFVVASKGFDSQATIGQGVVSLTDDGATNQSVKTGETLSMGNTCGYLGVNGQSSVNMWGVENFWGNIWKFVDDFTIEAKTYNRGYVEFDGFSVNTTANKNNIGFTISKTDGNIGGFGYDETVDFSYVPTKTGSNILSKDRIYQNNTYNGFLIARLGGRWGDGSASGCFSWALYYASGIRSRSIGARLVCIKKGVE